jgi:tellurite resistance protein
MVQKHGAKYGSGDSARVFDLRPLVFVSWADGKVQQGERVTILELLSNRHIEPGSDAALLIETLLEQRPSESFIAETLTVLQAMTRDRLTEGDSVVDWCLEVARASGGLFGLGDKTSPEERTLIEQIAAALGETAETRFRERLGR